MIFLDSLAFLNISRFSSPILFDFRHFIDLIRTWKIYLAKFLELQDTVTELISKSGLCVNGQGLIMINDSLVLILLNIFIFFRGVLEILREIPYSIFFDKSTDIREDYLAFPLFMLGLSFESLIL